MRANLASEDTFLRSLLDELEPILEGTERLMDDTHEVIHAKLVLLKHELKKELMFLRKRYDNCTRSLLKARARTCSLRGRNLRTLQGPGPTTRTTRSIRTYSEQGNLEQAVDAHSQQTFPSSSTMRLFLRSPSPQNHRDFSWAFNNAPIQAPHQHNPATTTEYCAILDGEERNINSTHNHRASNTTMGRRCPFQPRTTANSG